MNYTSVNIQGNIISSEIIDKIRSEEPGYYQQPSFFLRKTTPYVTR